MPYSCPIYTSSDNIELAKTNGFKAVTLNHVSPNTPFIESYRFYDAYNRIKTIINNETIPSFLDRVNFLTPSPLVTKLKEKSNLFGNSKIEIIEDEVNGNLASYHNDGTNHVIRININKVHQLDLDEEGITNAILHEIIHAYTNNMFNIPAELLNESEKIFVAKINQIYIQYKNKFDAYGLTSPKEFLAEYFTNPIFQERIKQQDNSFITRIINAVKSLFGIQSSNVLDTTFYTYINHLSAYSTPFQYTTSAVDFLVKDYDERSRGIQGQLKELIDNVKTLSLNQDYTYEQIENLRNYYTNLINNNNLQSLLLDYVNKVVRFLDNSKDAISDVKDINSVYKIHNEIKFHLIYLTELQQMTEEAVTETDTDSVTVKELLQKHEFDIAQLRQEMVNAHNIIMSNLKKKMHSEFMNQDTFVKSQFKLQYEKEFNADTKLKRNTPQYFRELERYITKKLNEDKELIEAEKNKRINNLLNFGHTDTSSYSRFLLPITQSNNQLLRWVGEKAAKIDYELNLIHEKEHNEAVKIKQGLSKTNDDLSWFEELVGGKRSGFFIAPILYGLFESRRKVFRESIKDITDKKELMFAYKKFNDENYEQEFTEEYYEKLKKFTVTEKTEQWYKLQEEINDILNAHRDSEGNIQYDDITTRDYERLSDLYKKQKIERYKVKRLSKTEARAAKIFWEDEHETEIIPQYYEQENKHKNNVEIAKTDLEEKQAVLNAIEEIVSKESRAEYEALKETVRNFAEIKNNLTPIARSLKPTMSLEEWHKTEAYKEATIAVEEYRKALEKQKKKKEEIKNANAKRSDAILEVNEAEKKYNKAEFTYRVWFLNNNEVTSEYGIETATPIKLWRKFHVTAEKYKNTNYVKGEKTLKKAIYDNKDFDKIINATPERKAFYDWYVNKRQTLDNTTKVQQLKYKLPSIEKTTFENFTNMEGDGILNKVKNYLYNRWKIQDKDLTEYGIDQNNLMSKEIPIFYRSSSVDPEALTQHYIDALLLDSYNVNRWKMLSENQPTFEVIKDIVKELSINKTSGGRILKRAKSDNISTIKGIDSVLYKQLSAFLDVFLYGEKKLDQKGAQLMDNLIQYTSKVLIGGNVISAIQNLTMGEAAFLLESVTNKSISKNAWIFAHKEYAKLSRAYIPDIINNTNESFLAQLSNIFQPINSNLEHPTIDQSLLERGLDGAGYIGLKFGSHMVKSLTMIGVLSNIKTFKVNESGEYEELEKNLYEHYQDKESNENIFISFNNEIIPLNDDSIFKIGKYIRAINNQLHENEQFIEAKRYWEGRAFGQMRNWLVSGFRRRYAGFGSTEKLGFMIPTGEMVGVYDDELETFYEGYYVTTLRFLTNSIRGLRVEGLKLSPHWNKLSNFEKQNVYKFAMDTIITFGSLFIADFFMSLAKEMGDDEDEFWKFQNAYYFYRMNLELRFYYDPSAILDIVKSPAPIFSMLGSFTTLMYQMLKDAKNVVVDGDLERYHSGIRKDESKLFHSLTKTLPYYRQYESWVNIEQRLKFL